MFQRSFIFSEFFASKQKLKFGPEQKIDDYKAKKISRFLDDH